MQLPYTRVILSTVLLLLSAHVAVEDVRATATDDGAPAEAAHSLIDDAWALSFGTTSLTLRSFLGSTISAKHHFADSRALRYGLSVRAQHRNRDDVGGATTAHVQLNTQYVVYPTFARSPEANIHLFYGAGPTVGLRVQELQGSHRDETLFTAGASGVIGAEWFVKTRISLTAEYRTSVEYSWGDDVRVFSVASSGGRAGVSVYF